jgi:hypothetical protein
MVHLSGDPSLTLRDDTGLVVWGEERSGDSIKTDQSEMILSGIAASFPLNPIYACHSER